MTVRALLRQQILFERLLSICTYAVRRYVISQFRPRIPLGFLLDTEPLGGGGGGGGGGQRGASGPIITTTRRYHPYATITTTNPTVPRYRSLPPELTLMIRRGPSLLPGSNSPNLFSYILPIADRLWSQARSTLHSAGWPRPAPIEVAHRMHNLYVWAGRVVSAVETVWVDELVRDEEVLDPRARRQLDAILAGGEGFISNNNNYNENELYDDNNVLGAVLAARVF